MATDEVGIYNLALSEVGAKSSVASVTEKSRAAELCNMWYQTTVETVLRAAPWPSATGIKRLALLKERDTSLEWAAADPDPGWQYAYSAPSDMLRPRYLSTYERFSSSLYNNSPAIMTNVDKAILVYTKRQLQVGVWDPQLKLAIVQALAAHIAMPLQGKPARAQRAAEAANRMILEARQAAANEDEDQHESMPDWFIARGYGYSTNYQRYVYPFGPLIQVTGGAGVE